MISFFYSLKMSQFYNLTTIFMEYFFEKSTPNIKPFNLNFKTKNKSKNYMNENKESIQINVKIRNFHRLELI